MDKADQALFAQLSEQSTKVQAGMLAEIKRLTEALAEAEAARERDAARAGSCPYTQQFGHPPLTEDGRLLIATGWEGPKPYLTIPIRHHPSGRRSGWVDLHLIHADGRIEAVATLFTQMPNPAAVDQAVEERGWTLGRRCHEVLWGNWCIYGLRDHQQETVIRWLTHPEAPSEPHVMRGVKPEKSGPVDWKKVRLGLNKKGKP